MPTSYYQNIENYIYIYQLGVYVILPTYPDSITDALGSTFATENILSRTAPVFSYSYSGPRTVTLNFTFHRDMMNSLNYDNFNFIDEVGNMLGQDYIDTLVRYLQAMALPSYNAVEAASSVYNSMVNPPIIAVRIGTTLFIKGIVNGEVQVTYSGPISKEGKYMQVGVSFTVSEIEPQDAEQVAKWGSYRGMESLLTRSLHKQTSIT